MLLKTLYFRLPSSKPSSRRLRSGKIIAKSCCISRWSSYRSPRCLRPGDCPAAIESCHLQTNRHVVFALDKPFHPSIVVFISAATLSWILSCRCWKFHIPRLPFSNWPPRRFHAGKAAVKNRSLDCRLHIGTHVIFILEKLLHPSIVISIFIPVATSSSPWRLPCCCWKPLYSTTATFKPIATSSSPWKIRCKKPLYPSIVFVTVARRLCPVKPQLNSVPSLNCRLHTGRHVVFVLGTVPPLSKTPYSPIAFFPKTAPLLDCRLHFNDRR